MLIFQHNSNPYENTNDVESWPSDLDLYWPSPLLELAEAGESTSSNSTSAPKPFQLMPFKERRLDNANYAMRVRDQYELLWHRSWKAPLLGEDDSPWILIEAGEKIGDHFRLEGAIRVHLSRFLHLHTDLWLIDLQSENLEQQSEFHWSQLPRPTSNREPCAFVQTRWPEAQRDAPRNGGRSQLSEDWYFPFGCPEGEYIAEEETIDAIDTLDNPDAVANIEPERSSNNDPAIYDYSSDRNDGGINANRTPERAPIYDRTYSGAGISEPTRPAHEILAEIYRQSSEEPTAIEQPPEPLAFEFPLKRITHIKSQRRMRSKELHYIDHPRVGILAIIHPVEKPKVEEEAIEYVPAPLPSSRVGNP